MRVTALSVVADRGRSTEDFVGAVPTATVVVDDAFIRGCRGGLPARGPDPRAAQKWVTTGVPIDAKS